MRIIELILDEDQQDAGIEAISIVENPAIESDFVALNSEEIKLAEVDKEKKILLGALLIPNKPIYRNGAEGEYYIFFNIRVPNFIIINFYSTHPSPHRNVKAVLSRLVHYFVFYNPTLN